MKRHNLYFKPQDKYHWIATMSLPNEKGLEVYHRYYICRCLSRGKWRFKTTYSGPKASNLVICDFTPIQVNARTAAFEHWETIKKEAKNLVSSST